MFENLQERLERSFKILKGQGRISEINVSETLKDVRRALLDADVNYKVAKQFTDTVKAKAMGQNVINALKPQELMLSNVRRELIDLMGGEKAPFNVKGNPAVVLMSGLQGSGKTTFSGKLALRLKTTQRRKRIASGSGTTIMEVNRLLTQFEQSRKMMRMATQMKNPAAMMKQMRQARKGQRR